jgi:hypothetical protein
MRTSKVKNENIESQKLVKGSKHQKSLLKWSERQKIRTTTTTYGVLPMPYYLWIPRPMGC